jgi:predicted ATPase
MIGAILGRRAPDGHLPGIFRQNQEEDAAPVANLIAVSFSAFDPADPLPFSTVGNRVSYSYVGLKTQPPKNDSTTDLPTNQQLPPAGNSPKDSAALAKEFADSMQKCQEGLRKARWRKALRTLETDPLFYEAEVASFAATDTEGGWRTSVMERFKALSSGHAIVLLTITRLVELVEERSLVLIDEPEGHLHPPLLSAFIRALSDLLIQRNGVAIVATHSPVVLQEVPKSCVWLLSRSRLVNRADRPEIETFGENVGVLTREVFGLEVIHSGFLALIDEAVKAHEGSYEAVLDHFGNQLGAEGRAIARGLCVGWTPGTPDELGHEEGE